LSQSGPFIGYKQWVLIVATISKVNNEQTIKFSIVSVDILMKYDLSTILLKASGSPEKRIICVKWAPDGARLAVSLADQSMSIFSANGDSVSRIPIKAKEDDAKKAFAITGFDWSPDSTKLVISQSDQLVSIYDIGPANVSDYKKKISARFNPRSTPLCVSWPVNSQNETIYGLSDGSVHMGLLQLKRTEEVYKHSSSAISIAASNRQNAVVIGHLDGNVFVVNIDNRARTIALQTAVPPLALSWGSHIVAAGSDLQINFADSNGGSNSHVDFSNQQALRCFTAATFDPSGTTALVAGKNSLFTFNYSSRIQSWVQVSKIDFEGLYHVPSVSWSSDGSRIAVSSATGSLFILTVSMGSYRYKNLFECINVTGSQLRVVDLQDKSELNIRSEFRILNTKFQHDRYVIVRTPQTFVVGDMKSKKTSEMPATMMEGDNAIKERFVFIDDIAVLVWNTGELTVVEFGKQTPLAAIPTQYASSYLLSLRFGSKLGRGDSKVLSYLVDSRTIRIIDLETQLTICTVQVQNKIDWLELNISGTMLLFRDAKRSLYLYNIQTKSLNGLLNVCSYAQWVPEANVIVAQSKKTLNVWYSPSSPDEVRVSDIEGDIVDIQRSGTKTSVSIQNAGTLLSIPLDGSFISFSAAMESKKLKEAAQILMEMQDSSNINSLWEELSEAATRDHDYQIAELSFAKLGDLPKSRFLHKLNKLIQEFGLSNSQVQARTAMLQSNFKQAEYCFIEHDQLDSAIDMYRSMHMWNELLDLAEIRAPGRAASLREEYFTHLMSTGQYHTAAKLKAARGEVSEAVDLCLQGNKPQLAAEILLSHQEIANPQLLSHVAEALKKNNRFDIAGQIYEKLGNAKEALESFRKGHSYYNALELAKAAAPDLVVTIQHEWADHLVSIQQNQAAIAHYADAGDYPQALNCAIHAQQWRQAADILHSLRSSSESKDNLRLQYMRVARHFASNGDPSTAEDLFLIVDAHKELVEMFLNLGRVQEATRHSKKHLKPADMESLFIKTAKILGKKAQTRKIAEEILVSIKKTELAVEMYTSAGDTENIARLSTKIDNKSQLETMGAQAERDGNLAQAEQYYVKAGQWQKALFMYRQEKKYNDALRIAKQNGTAKDEVSIAIQWAKEIGGAAGVQKLQSLNLLEPALIYCCENNAFDFALVIINNSKSLNSNVVQEAYLKIAVYFEGINRFAEAEQYFILGNKPTEAIEMYTHNKMTSDAQRVAAKYGLSSTVGSVKTSGPVASTKNQGMLKKAMQLEQNRQYEDAIITYISLTPQDCGSEERYIQVLERAVKVSANFVQSRLQEIVTNVAQILIGMNKHASLGKILEGIEAYMDAVEIYKIANMWEDAKRLSGYLEPDEQEQFRRDYQKHLASSNNISQMMNIGEIDSALDILAQKGNWDTCLQEAQKNGQQYVEKYTMLYAQSLVNVSNFDKAIEVLAKYAPSANTASIPAYISLCQTTIYGVPSYQTLQPSFFSLRQMMFKVYLNCKPGLPGFDKLESLTRAVHLLCQQVTLSKFGLVEQAQKAAMAALRYCDIIPSDYLFYQAGNLMEKASKPENALAFYVRFVDIADVISSSGSPAGIDHKLFEQTDVPRDLCLRKQLSFPDSVVNTVNDWILSKTVSADFEPQLPTSPCVKCGRKHYSANLVCPFCRNASQFCHITGFPVTNPAKCTSCGLVSNKPDWGFYISKAGRCPCCDSPQTAGA